MRGELVRVLLVDDDEDDYLITRDMLSDIEGWRIEFDWVDSYDRALEVVSRQAHDVYLFDYRLGERSGLELLREAVRRGCRAPMILLTGQGDLEVDVEASQAGAADYLVKNQISAPFLERSIRYAIKHKRAEEKLRAANEELCRTYESLERAQASAIASEKLAALGRLTAGVSHEILNPMNVITIRLYMLLNDPSVPRDVLRQLQTMEEQCNRIVKITQDLLYFSRQRPPERQLLDLNGEVERVVGLMEHEMELQSIEVELDLDEGLPAVSADMGQLQQVVLNLLTNARDAMPKGGRLTLSTASVRSNGHPWVELRVRDTGGGVAPEHMDKLFEPFFTTKPEGKGTGLGLSICRGIIQSHGGRIRAEGCQGEGMSFVVSLPLDGARNSVLELEETRTA